MVRNPQEVDAALESLRSSIEELKRERARDRSELEHRLRVLELAHGAGTKDPESALPGTAEDKQGPALPEDATERLEHELGGTVWEAAALIGLPQLCRGASVMLALSMVLNVVVQMYICFVLSGSSSFVGTGKYRELMGASQRWRFTVAHQLEQVDAGGTSLAARVCGGGDESLAWASSQAGLLSEINDYIGLDAGDLEATRLGDGPLICGVCLFLFVVLVLRELRAMVTSLLAVAAIPSGPTRVEDGAWVAMSFARKVCFLLMGVLRAGVAVALLVTGVLWLSSTSSTTDLILNAAALGFVMDLDELLLETTVPAAVHTLVGKLQPVVYPKPPWHLEAAVPLVASFCVVAACLASLVLPNMDDMLDLKKVLCGGNLDFIATKTPVGYMASRTTAPFLADGSFELGGDLALLAVQELRSFDVEGNVSVQYSVGHVSDDDFTRTVQTTFSQLSQDGLCADMDTYKGGVALQEIPAWFTSVRQSTGLQSGLSLAEEPWTCAAHAPFCDSNGLLRNICSITCGCTDPLSGLLLLMPEWGCPVMCRGTYLETVANSTCEDQDVAGHPGWARYWQSYSHFVARMLPLHAAAYEEFAKANTAGGCSDVSPDPIIGHNFCDDRDSFMAGSGLGSILPFCPGTCCRGPNPPEGCPGAC